MPVSRMGFVDRTMLNIINTQLKPEIQTFMMGLILTHYSGTSSL
jgi:hypothetical protein